MPPLPSSSPLKLSSSSPLHTKRENGDTKNRRKQQPQQSIFWLLWVFLYSRNRPKHGNAHIYTHIYMSMYVYRGVHMFAFIPSSCIFGALSTFCIYVERGNTLFMPCFFACEEWHRWVIHTCPSIVEGLKWYTKHGFGQSYSSMEFHDH